ncbi:MAG: beta-L-arabinofuranosidase domain-containing protein [Planctomycetota bacterium]
MGSTHITYRPLPVGAVRPAGWMLAQMRRDLEIGFAGCLIDLSPRTQADIFGARKVSSRETRPDGALGDTPSSWWNGETEAMAYDGLMRLGWLADHEPSRRRTAAWVDRVLAHQDADGYIGIYTEANRYNHDDENGELWAQGRALAALLAFHEMTGRRDVLDAVRRAADLTLTKYGPGRSYYLTAETPGGGMGHSLMVVDTMAWLHRLTGDERYAAFARFLYHDYSACARLRDRDNQVDALLDPDRPMFGHTPHVVEHMRVPLRLWAATGQELYRRLAEASYRKVLTHLAPSGGCIGNENVDGRPGSADRFYEYCSITEHLISLHAFVGATGRFAEADLAEHLLFNAAQGARLADGTAISYLARDNRFWCLPEPIVAGRPTLSPTHNDLAVCCNPNAMRILPYHVSGMWRRFTAADGAEGLAAVFYGPCVVETTVAGGRVCIEQHTAYPFELSVRLAVDVDGERRFLLVLRIPGWADAAVVRVNGTEVLADGPCCTIRRAWRTGDEVTVEFGASIRRRPTPGGREFITHGPLMYALPIEAQRLPTRDYGVRGLQDAHVVPADAEPREAPERTTAGYRRYLATLPSVRRADVGLPQRLYGTPDWRVETTGAADTPHPWDASPVSLIVEMADEDCVARTVRLVPLGTTLLRRSAFEPRHIRRRKT